jgi:hypothetical protein
MPKFWSAEPPEWRHYACVGVDTSYKPTSVAVFSSRKEGEVEDGTLKKALAALLASWPRFSNEACKLAHRPPLCWGQPVDVVDELVGDEIPS